MRKRIVPIAGLFVSDEPDEAWIREATGKNDGRLVEAIQRVTGNGRGDAWCASAVCLVLELAFKGKTPLPITASCDELLAAAIAKRWLQTTPEPGDVFLLLRVTDYRVRATGPNAIELAPIIPGGARAIPKNGALTGFFAQTQAGPLSSAVRITASRVATQQIELAAPLPARADARIRITDAVHTGIVTAVSGAVFKTSEGNTNKAGARDGWGWYARERPIVGCAFIRIPDVIPAESIAPLARATASTAAPTA